MLSNSIITTGRELFSLLVSHARSGGPTATYPPCVIRLTDRVVNHLLDDGIMEDLAADGPSPLRQLAEWASVDLVEGAALQPFSIALVDLAFGLYEGNIGCEVVGLARLLGFDEDGLAYEFISGKWFVVSTPRFERETGFAVKSPGGTFQYGLPVLSAVTYDGRPLPASAKGHD
jgi:hypothetical protein